MLSPADGDAAQLIITPGPFVNTSNPDDIADAIGAAAVKVTAAVAIRVMKRLIKATPVKTGHAQSNWLVAVGGPDTRIIGSKTDVKYGAQKYSMSKIKSYVPRGAKGLFSTYSESFEAIYISNNVPYILVLNTGTSTQAPPAFIERAFEAESISFENVAL